MNYPKMCILKQTFDKAKLENIPTTIINELDKVGVNLKVKAGEKVGITAGSRGVANIATITKTVVDYIKALGAKPYILPCMGSHGGATAEGQIKVLEGYGITEETMGCPIRSTMEVEVIGNNNDGLSIFLDKYALEADHLIVINRVKLHTKFEGPVESGLMKMMAVGMGKRHGADLYHKACVQYGMNRVIGTVGLVVMEKSPILCGLGIVENAYDQTTIIKAFSPNELLEGEKKLLKVVRMSMATLPFDDIDILLIDEIGKDISGTGMDTNVIGINRDILGTFASTPRVKRCVVFDLSKNSKGNAAGIGLAHYTTTRLVEKMDRISTYMNCLTAIAPEKAAIPMYFDTDKECIDAALNTIGLIEPTEAKIIHIKNTLHIEKVAVSQGYAKDLEDRIDLRIIKTWFNFPLDNKGNLLSLF